METSDITKLSVAEKLRLMETLWASLTPDLPPSSPAWHDAVLSERLHQLREGKEPTSSWREAKERLRSKITPL